MLYSYLYIGSLMSLDLYSRTCTCCLLIISNTSHLINCSSNLFRFFLWDVIESSDGRLQYLNTSFTYFCPITSIQILHFLAQFLSFTSHCFCLYFMIFISLTMYLLGQLNGKASWKIIGQDLACIAKMRVRSEFGRYEVVLYKWRDFLSHSDVIILINLILSYPCIIHRLRKCWRKDMESFCLLHFLIKTGYAQGIYDMRWFGAVWLWFYFLALWAGNWYLELGLNSETVTI